MKFQLTKHAQRALAEREIPIEWVQRTVEAPEVTLPDPNDATVQRCFRRIPELGGRAAEGVRPLIYPFRRHRWKTGVYSSIAK